MKEISEKQEKVLRHLAEIYGDDSNCTYFKYTAKGTGLTVREVRLACRALKRKGYASFERGLFDDEGKVAGSGYCATREGAMLVNACNKCAKNPADGTDGTCSPCYEKSNPNTN